MDGEIDPSLIFFRRDLSLFGFHIEEGESWDESYMGRSHAFDQSRRPWTAHQGYVSEHVNPACPGRDRRLVRWRDGGRKGGGAAELWFAKIVNSREMKPMAGAPKGLEFVQDWHHDSPS